MGNKTRGKRTDYAKISITMPPEMALMMRRLGIKLQLKGVEDTDMSSLVRQACQEYLKKAEIEGTL
jgi:hypothetical protein